MQGESLLPWSFQPCHQMLWSAGTDTKSEKEKTHLSLPTEIYALQANVLVP